jgi:hypothetical protein
VLGLEPTIVVGELVFDVGRPLLRQPVVAAAIDPAHLDRVMDAVAREAARLACDVRRDDCRATGQSRQTAIAGLRGRVGVANTVVHGRARFDGDPAPFRRKAVHGIPGDRSADLR